MENTAVQANKDEKTEKEHNQSINIKDQFKRHKLPIYGLLQTGVEIITRVQLAQTVPWTKEFDIFCKFMKLGRKCESESVHEKGFKYLVSQL